MSEHVCEGHDGMAIELCKFRPEYDVLWVTQSDGSEENIIYIDHANLKTFIQQLQWYAENHGAEL